MKPLKEPQYREKLLGDLASLGGSLDTKRLVALVQKAYDLLDSQVRFDEEKEHGFSIAEEFYTHLGLVG